MNKLKLGIAFFLTAVVAFIAGHYCSIPPTSGRAAGDVGRAKVYTKSVVEIDADNLQERLQSDSVFCAATTSRAARMQSQAHDLASLIEKSNSLVGGNDSFDATLGALNVPYQSILNACSAIDLYVSNLAKLSEGGDVNGFEQSYNNALLGYYLVSSKDGLADAFSSDLQNYLAGSEPEKSEEIKNLLGDWTLYSLASAVMSGDVLKAQKLSAVINEYELSLLSNQEKLRDPDNQEQLNGFIFNQEQLNLIRNQEQLNQRNQEQLNLPL